MFSQLKESYAQLRRSQPGKRFQELYERRAQGSHSRKTGMLVAGAALIVVGLVLMILPGPGIPFLVAGFGLIAQELRVVARALDRIELQLRALKASMTDDAGSRISSLVPREQGSEASARTERGVNADFSNGD